MFARVHVPKCMQPQQAELYSLFQRGTLTGVFATAIPAATVDRLKISARAGRLVRLISVAVTSAAAANARSAVAAAAAIVDSRQQFRTSWRCGRIVINANARASTYLKALAGARAPVRPGRPATPCATSTSKRERAKCTGMGRKQHRQHTSTTGSSSNIKCKMCGNGNVS